MKERPILFSAPMVRALLEDSKTQTRRIAKLPNVTAPRGEWMPSTVGGSGMTDSRGHVIPEQACIFHSHTGDALMCPHGQPWDRLWVRETWGVVSHSWDDNGNMMDWTPDRPATAIQEMRFGQGYYSGHVIYAADGRHEWAGDDDGGGEPRSAWHPSIHMPRAASRITLEITGVRVERLQDISDKDCKAEGVLCETAEPWFYHVPEPGNVYAHAHDDPKGAYRNLWESINGAGSWAANPWVWVVEFKRVQP